MTDAETVAPPAGKTPRLLAVHVDGAGRQVVYVQASAVKRAFTIAGWAAAYALPPLKAKHLLRTGRGPTVIRIGAAGAKRPRLLITLEAAEAWAREQSAPYAPSRADWFVTPAGERT